jgi:hypothetical protein
MSDFRDDDIVAYLKIAVRRNGAMSVEGNIEDEMFAKSMLDAARDSITNHHHKINDNGLILSPQAELMK